MDRFLQMQTFTAVVDAGSFVCAAERLDISRAAASRHVADLEARLGVRLLHRTTRRLSLTHEGETFLVRCRTLLAEMEEAEAELSSRAEAAVGLLRINAPVSFGIRQLAPLWADFLQLHPKLRIEVTLADRLVDLVEEGYDVAIRISSLRDSSLIGRPLATTQIVMCASPEYLQRNGVPETHEDLQSHSVIGYSYWSTGDEWRLEGPQGPVVVKTRPRLQANNGDTCRAAALAHQGIILQPTFLVGLDIAAGYLVPILPDYKSIELGIYAVYPTRKHVAPKVRTLIEFLDQRLSDMSEL
ncbi:MAG: LysR family transcriptional regulator [Lysobacteraceae bacterium]|nr:MAG: LysR family transcriptional regulator [Xanthomonadaceae bacterium]